MPTESNWQAPCRLGPSSLHRDGVDAEELRRMILAIVLLANVGLEHAVGGPLELPQLTGEGRTTQHREATVAYLTR